MTTVATVLRFVTEVVNAKIGERQKADGIQKHTQEVPYERVKRGD